MVVFSVLLEHIVYFLLLIMLIAVIGVSSAKVLYMDHGVLHDPDSITYQNHCNFCDNKYFSSKRIPSNQAALLTPNPSNVMTHQGRHTTQFIQISSMAVMNSEDLIVKLLDDSSQAPTPTRN
jgi:hypothetical protein